MRRFALRVLRWALFFITIILLVNACGGDVSRQWTEYHARDRNVSCPIVWYPESGVFLSCEGKKRKLYDGIVWTPFADYTESERATGTIPTTRELVNATHFACIAEDWRASRWFGTWLGNHAHEETRTQYTHCRPEKT